MLDQQPALAEAALLDDRMALAVRTINKALEQVRARPVNDLEVKVLKDRISWPAMLAWWESSLGVKVPDAWILLAEWHVWNTQQ